MPWGVSRERDGIASTISELRPWDAVSALVIPESIESGRMHRFRGMGGDSVEILQNLHASLRVGRFDRAANLVLRLKNSMPHDDPQLRIICNEYLRGLVNRLRDGKDTTYQSIQQWFEVDMKAFGIEPDATSYTLMVKACMMSLTGSKQERTLRRYLALAQEAGHDVWAQVISSGEFSGMEWSSLVKLQPQQLNPIPFELEEEFREEIENKSDKKPAPVLTNYTETPIEALPEARAMEQKGLGLQTLKKSLSIFYPPAAIPYPHELDGTKEEKDRVWSLRRQEQLEEDVYAAALERWRVENENMAKMGINTALKSKPMEALLLKWHTALVGLLKKEMKDIKSLLDNWNPTTTHSDVREAYGPFLEQFKPEQLATIAILGFVNAFVGQGVAEGIKVTSIAGKLSNILEVEATMLLSKLQNNKKRKSKVTEERLQMLGKLYRGDLSSVVEQQSIRLQTSRQKVREFTKTEWPKDIKLRIGAMLIRNIIESAKVEVTRPSPKTGELVTFSQPAFSHTYVFRGGRKLGMIMAHQTLVERLGKEPVRGVLGSRLPMIAQPRPWEGVYDGGYLLYSVSVVRQKDKDEMQRMYVQAAADNGDLDQIFAGLDVLGKTPWKVNRNVLKVMLDAWNSGEGIGRIAPENPDLTIPEKPDPSAGAIARAKWVKIAKQIENERCGLHSERCFQNFQMEIGRALVDETFYFPHNLDFRGRAYPIPPYLNHIGADFARGMLLFAKGKELGEVGLSWLKVHLANVFGYDKASIREREEFTMKHIDNVFDSAENPLNGTRWWLKAEDPWQCLAACMEITQALKSEDPTRYVSHLAIHQDGTCNGLQHYAALGGDEAGASQVNLEPGDRPADVYTAVAEIVKADIAANAAEGHPVAQALDGKITRKVVKQTVMTNVYGVTFMGARAQVQKQLEVIMPDHKETPGMEMLCLASHVARSIFKALSTMFSGATEIQKWLGESANRICLSVTPEQIAAVKDLMENGAASSSAPRLRKPRGAPKTLLNSMAHILKFKSTIVWTTPLKLPVAQPYRVAKQFQAHTPLQQIAFHDARAGDAVHKRKQLQAFPPNFIHSLDATHMLLSALKCDEIGLTFASVHDSFWTHAADIPSLNFVLRDAFIRMHSEDIIGRLAEEFKVRYKGCLYLKTISAVSQIGIAVATFRSENCLKGFDGGVQELMMESERQRLLNSEDAKERKEGQQMVTPASIYESMTQDSSKPSENLDMAILGAVPKGSASPEIPKRGRGRPRKVLIEDELAAEEAEKMALAAEVEPIDEDLVGATEASSKDEIPLTAMLAGTESEQSSEETITTGETDGPAKKTGKRNTKSLPHRVRLNIWLPLTFPEAPKKGSFDVSRLRESKYFFS